jgi:ABC-type phosphate transport system substrate-binding protein
MIARRSPLLAGALICGALIAGCGSGGNSTTSGSTATTTTSSSAAAATTSTPATSTTSAGSTAANPISSADLAAAVSECKAVAQRAPTLSSALKSKVEGICNKAANGNIAGARAAAKEVCVEVINASPIPSAEKTQALAACKTS